MLYFAVVYDLTVGFYQEARRIQSTPYAPVFPAGRFPSQKMLKIYNTLHREKQEFVPLVPGKVRMYVCGMTVYDYCHLGHARVLVVFDLVQRWLRSSGFEVTYVRNVTDIDDKIIKRAQENKEPIGALTERLHRLHERGCGGARCRAARLRAARDRVCAADAKIDRTA